MIPEIFAAIAFLVESCTGIVLSRVCENNRQTELDRLVSRSPTAEEALQDFIEYDPNDCIFQEYEPAENRGQEPKAWRESLPSFKTSVMKCLRTVLLIQTVAGGLIGLAVVGIVILDFVFAELCYDMNGKWNDMPRQVQSLRVTAQAIEGGLIEMWDFTCIIAIFPFSLINNLHLFALTLLATFIDISYRLYLQMIGSYGVAWRSFLLNALFSVIILTNNYILARHFYPQSLKNTLKLDFILSAQFLLGLPAALMLVYVMIPWYVNQDPHIKVVIASLSPLLTAIPKVASRLGAQTLEGIIHPGTAHVLVASIYGASALVFRVMQAELNGFGYFVALGVAHGVIDLIERITITMRDQIWEYLYRLLRRQRRPLSKYRSPRSRRFIADVSIQMMLQEATGLVGVLGYMAVYQYIYQKPSDKGVIVGFINRAITGLLIDLFFNTISLLIQTRVMNIAVCRVWRKKWRSHVIITIFSVSISAIYFSEYLLRIVKDKYSAKIHFPQNCTYPAFL